MLVHAWSMAGDRKIIYLIRDKDKEGKEDGRDKINL
jgi:hypothetical protein